MIFNFRAFGVSFVQGTLVSLTNFYIALWAMEDKAGTRIIGDYQSFAMIIATAAILTVLIEVSCVSGAKRQSEMTTSGVQ